MTAALVHPYLVDELAAGRAQAERFLERIAAGPTEVDALAQQVELARMGSQARLRRGDQDRRCAS